MRPPMKSLLVSTLLLSLSACALLAPAVQPTAAAASLAAPQPVAAVPSGVAQERAAAQEQAATGERGLAEGVDAGGEAGVDAGCVATKVEAEGSAAEVDDEATVSASDAPVDDGEGEALAEVAPPDAGYLYTADLSDAELERRWRNEPASLGSIAVGLVGEGRLINAIPFPEGEAWTVIVPEACWTTRETADFIIAAARDLRAQFPDAPPVRVGQVSAREGGFLPPHVTHQNGLDVDVGLFYPGPEPYRVREREKVMDVALNWAFLKAVIVNGDVQGVLLDKRVQKVLFEYALRHGEDRAWLDSLFHAGPRSLVHHARRHRDHFHIRYFNPRAQELAWRLAPLMATRADQNIAFHRIQRGDSLGRIAHRMGSTVKRLCEANHLTSTSVLRVGQVLKVPLRGPCTSCPRPPHVVVPQRRMPPTPAVRLSHSARAG